MSRIDWQAFLDGSLDAEAMAAAERTLRENPRSVAELEGLRRFREAVREAGVAEPIPEMRLEAMLRKTVGTPKPARRMWPLAASLACAAAAVWAFFAYDLLRFTDPMRLDLSPTRAILATRSPVEASKWVEANVGFEAPVIDLGAAATLATARRGDAWACYDYQVNGQTYYLYMCPDPHDTGDSGQSVTLSNGKRVLKGRGLRWRQDGMCYYLRGPDDDVEARLTVLAMERIGANENRPGA